MSDPKKKPKTGIDSDIPQSVFEEALKAVESMERTRRKPPGQSSSDTSFSFNDSPNFDDLLDIVSEKKSGPDAKKKDTFYTLDEQTAEDELEMLSRLLEDDKADEFGEDLFRSVLGEGQPQKTAPPKPEPKRERPTRPVERKPQPEQRRPAAPQGKPQQQSQARPSAPPPPKPEAVKPPRPEQQTADDCVSSEIVAEKDKQIKELSDRLVRQQAEFENYRKRVSRENVEAKRFHNEKIFQELLPVLDNFALALGHMETATDTASMLEGVRLIYKQLMVVLDNNNVQVIDTKDEKFNPMYHEAMGAVPNSGKEPGTILSEYQTGFLLNGRLLRPSRVLIAMAGDDDENASESNNEDSGETKMTEGEQ